jgi:hypothetical protein
MCANHCGADRGREQRPAVASDANHHLCIEIMQARLVLLGQLRPGNREEIALQAAAGTLSRRQLTQVRNEPAARLRMA